MQLITFADNSVLTQDNGTIRVRGSRITLDTIVARFKMGNSLEFFHEGFPTLSLEVIKTIRAWYLKNQAAADEYLRARAEDGNELRKHIESQPWVMSLRKKIRMYRDSLTRR